MLMILSWYITDNNNSTLASNLYNYDMQDDGDTVIVYLVTGNVYGCQNDTDKVTPATYVDPIADFTISDTAVVIY